MKNFKALTVDPAAYARLLKAIRAEIAAGKKLMQQAEAVTNWKVGKYISEFILQGKDRAGYGERVYEKLAEDLNIDKRTLRHSVEFSRKFPIVSARSQLTWTHYRTLLGLPDPSARRELAGKSLRENLNTRQLRREVARYKVDHKIPAVHQPIPKLTAERGKLFTYRSVPAKKPASPKDKCPVKKVKIDCGFNVWRTIALLRRSTKASVGVPTDIEDGASGETPQKVSPGTIYTSIKIDDENHRLRPAPNNDPKELFTYKAEVERVVDADTLWVVIDCGFDTEARKKVRLRGINAPELDTRLGRRAKRFVEKLLKPCSFIVVKTYKDQSDKYERYLVDIYFKQGEPDPAAVAAAGEYLNQRLLDEGLAQAYKE